MTLHNGFQRGEDFLYCLAEFGLMGVFLFDPVYNTADIGIHDNLSPFCRSVPAVYHSCERLFLISGF
jgi:hypothetical protein